MRGHDCPVDVPRTAPARSSRIIRRVQVHDPLDTRGTNGADTAPHLCRPARGARGGGHKRMAHGSHESSTGGHQGRAGRAHQRARSASQPKEARDMQHTHKPMLRWVPVMAIAPLLLAFTRTPGGATGSSRSVAGTQCVQLLQVQQRGQASVQFPSTVETLDTRPRAAQPGGPLAPPVGVAGPPPLGAVGPPPLGAAGPPPVDAVGPPPLGAAGSILAPLAEPSQGRPSPVQPRRVR